MSKQRFDNRNTTHLHIYKHMYDGVVLFQLPIRILEALDYPKHIRFDERAMTIEAAGVLACGKTIKKLSNRAFCYIPAYSPAESFIGDWAYTIDNDIITITDKIETDEHTARS